jgi:hypothetical protein
LREVEAPTFSDIRLTDGGKVVGPTRRPLFTPRAIVWLEGLDKLKKSTSSGTRTGDLKGVGGWIILKWILEG